MVMGQLTNKNVATVYIGIWKGAMSDAEGIQVCGRVQRGV